jgi:hypothetical protein
MKNAKRSLSVAAVLLALLALPSIYGHVTGQPIGGNTILQTDAPSGSAPAFRANGNDANISINIVPKGTGTLQVNGSPVTAGSSPTFTSLTVNGATTLNGTVQQQVGTSGVLKNDGALALFHSFTQVATVGTGEETAYTFSLPANSLAVDGSYITIATWSTAGATGTNKQLKVKFGATTISDSTAANFASGALLSPFCYVMRTGAATQRAWCKGTDGVSGGGLINGASTNSWTNMTTPAETLSGAVTILITQQSATAANQTANGAIITWYPNGQ